MEVIILIYIACLIIGTCIDGLRGFLLAFLLSWIGVIISLIWSGNDKKRRQHEERMEILLAAGIKNA